MPWVTSCGVHEPVMVQMVRGCTGSVTSASTGWVDPCTVMRASCAAAAPGQLACIAAHEGTATGLADGLGVGLSVGVGLSDGLAEAVLLVEGDGLLCAAVPLLP